MKNRHSNSSQSNSSRHRLHKLTPIRPRVIRAIHFGKMLEASLFDIEIAGHFINKQECGVQRSNVAFRTLIFGRRNGTCRKELKIHNYREFIGSFSETRLNNDGSIRLTETNLIRRLSWIKLRINVRLI